MFEETDPTVPQHVKNISEDDIVRWNSGGLINLSNYYTKNQSDNRFAKIDDVRLDRGATAYSWGNHAGLYQEKENQRLSTTNNVVFNSAELTTKLYTPHNLGSTRKVSISAASDGSGGSIPPPPLTSVSWADITGPLSGNAVITTALNGKVDTLGYNKSNWDAAFANSHTHGNKEALDLITSLKISNWDSSYSWGNHSGLYQEKENQRLSTTNNVVFSSAELTTKLSIPHNLGSTRKVSLSAATDGSGGSVPPPPITSVTWGMISGSLSAQVDLTTALNSKAAINGVNATGTWPISIGGSAHNSTYWNGLSFIDSELTSPVYFLTSAGSGIYRYSSKANVKAALNISDDSLLNNNISGYSQRLEVFANQTWLGSNTPSWYPMGLTVAFVGDGMGFPNYGSLMNLRGYSGGGGSLQMYVPYGPSYGGNNLRVRFGNYSVNSGNSWTNWKVLANQFDPLFGIGGGNIQQSTINFWEVYLGSGSGGINIKTLGGGQLGYVYSDGNSFGLLNNTGGWSVKALGGLSYGGELTGNWSATGGFGAQGLYDSGSRVLSAEGNSSGYYQVNNWLQLNGDFGIYNPTINGAHLQANGATTYGAWYTSGSRGGYSGIYDQYSGVNYGMFDSSGNGGMFKTSSAWYFYWNNTNMCAGIGTADTDPLYSLYAPKGVKGARIEATTKLYIPHNLGSTRKVSISAAI